jgi:electron transfer flavoprotein beta subunit
MGPPQAVDAVTEAIGMGADRGILLSDPAFAGADTWATSYTLGKAIEKLGAVDLVLCGRQAIDGDTAQIGPQVAEYLQLPQVSYVDAIETLDKRELTVRRRLEDGYERIACPLPALLTVIAELNRPRYAEVGRLIAGCGPKAPIAVWNAADIGVQTRDVGLEGSLTHVIRTFAPAHKREGELLEGGTAEVVDQLIDRLAASEGATACKAVAAACRLR